MKTEILQNEKNMRRGWTVTLAGTGINLALGVLYSWSILSGEITGWTQTMKSVPYSIACGIFALAMIPAGRLQDRVTPRFTATIGGVLTGVGFIICAIVPAYAGFIIGFGLLAGIGIGFGYAAATPPAIKWFPPQKTGLIAGIVVAGFGLASAYIGPLGRWMLGSFGLQTTMLILGISFLVVVVILSQLLKNPPPGYAAVTAPKVAAQGKSVGAALAEMPNVEPSDMIRTSRFWLLWIMFACGAGSGLMIIGKLKPIVQEASKLAWFAPLCLAFLAVGNASGRILAGLLSDKIGRTMTMLLIFLCQAAVMVCLVLFGKAASFVFFLSFLAGFNYGANLSIFPSAAKDLFGLKNFGTNYGILFTAWGFGGVVLPIIAGRVADATGNFNLAYIIAALCLLVAAALTLVVRNSDRKLIWVPVQKPLEVEG
jgi:OFA family oxalate/formate antiporter-like MFS transporter